MPMLILSAVATAVIAIYGIADGATKGIAVVPFFVGLYATGRHYQVWRRGRAGLSGRLSR